MSEDTNTPQAEAPAFGIQDLIFTLQVYEAAAQRGAFRAEELSQVGALYDRLKTFLIAIGASFMGYLWAMVTNQILNIIK